MENSGLSNDQLVQGETKETLASRAELMKLFRECSVENLKARRQAIVSALEKNYSKKEKNDNIKRLIKRYEWEKEVISDMLEGR